MSNNDEFPSPEEIAEMERRIKIDRAMVRAAYPTGKLTEPDPSWKDKFGIVPPERKEK